MPDIVYRSGSKSGVLAFKAKKSITRAANATPYTVGDLINGTGATALIEFDFGSDFANQVIEVNSATILSDNIAAATKLDSALWFFNTSTILGAGDASQVNDNAAFAPTLAQVDSKMEGVIETLPNVGTLGTVAYTINNSEKAVEIKLDSSGKVWIAPTANNTYIPANGEVLRLTIKGYILG